MTFDTNMIIIIVAVLAALILAFLLLRPRRQRIDKAPAEKSETYVARTDRPYLDAEPAPPAMPEPAPPQPAAPKPAPVSISRNDWVTDEVAAATTDVAGEVLGVDAHRELDGGGKAGDDLQRLKGVGPKLAARLRELGIIRFDQLASLGAEELVMLDDRLGPFKGRLARDRIAEQADYLARGDTAGFEAKFGKLGG